MKNLALTNHLNRRHYTACYHQNGYYYQHYPLQYRQ